MVSLSEAESSNVRIASALPPGLVAVFVGATSGIGHYTLKQFVQHARQPRIYFVGRSHDAGERIAAECQQSDPDGQYTFLQADTSLIRNIDNLCREIANQEKTINLLFLSTGTLLSHTETTEGLHFATSVVYYSRTRFIVNLLPLLRSAPHLRRVVTVFGAGKEGPITTSDWQAWKVPMLSQRGHVSSMTTLSLEALAKEAPEVSFIHNFPGVVKTNLARGGEGLAVFVLKQAFKVLNPLLAMSNRECGERQTFLATSARYPSKTAEACGVPLIAGLAAACGTNGQSGSGVYSVDMDGTSAGAKVEALLAKFRDGGLVEMVWKHTMEEFERITGVRSISDGSAVACP
ncbi:MAG: hypothetical protein L6R36_004888 [Xanthoria steineri]|nr:MAG: hypothetical protein L6R36_004888 [Xanthoria steineri]